MLRIYSRALVRVGMGKPWYLVKPVSVVASRNLSQQKGLPRLPVPSLQQSLENYLSFLEPILELDELQRATELVEEFQKQGGVGERLQRDLERAASNTDNWMTDKLKIVHHKERSSVVVHFNYGMSLPRGHFKDKQAQTRCAAELIEATLHVKTMIDNDTLPIEYIRGKPLCMEQYKEIMSSCRIPQLKMDSMMFYTRKHITVVHNCQFFVLEVHNSDGTLLTVDQLCVQLERIYNSSLQTDMEPVGILTTENRDNWSKTYMNLIQDETNKASVSTIQSSIFTLCLDGAMPPVSEEMYYSSDCHQILQGGGSQWNSANRWFDKGLQLIIREDGTSGINLCHAVADGSVGVKFCDHIVESLNRKKPQVMQSHMEPLPAPQKLHFNITPEIKKDIEEAKQHMDILARDVDLRYSVFDHFGGKSLKANKLSPNDFVQMAVQLAYYRTHQRFCQSMELVSLRMFRLGRLSFNKLHTPASANFVKAFDDPNKQNSEKVDLLEKSMEAHRLNITNALEGNPSETHLLGLMQQSTEEKIPMPDIFTDPTFLKSFQYRFFATQVTSSRGCQVCNGSYSPGLFEVVFGINDYDIDLYVSSLSAGDSCTESNGVRLMGALHDALLDMRTLLQQTSRPQL